jgi:hypothetical protein
LAQQALDSNPLNQFAKAMSKMGEFVGVVDGSDDEIDPNVSQTARKPDALHCWTGQGARYLGIWLSGSSIVSEVDGQIPRFLDIH